MSPELMSFKPKRKTKNARNKYLNAGSLDQLSCSRTTTRNSTDVSKRKLLLESKKRGETNELHHQEAVQNSILSPIKEFQTAAEVNMLHRQPQTPKTPKAVNPKGLSRLESLPMDLLVKILCYLHHDQLGAVFHVSQRIRGAVLSARQQHFDYTTPDRSRQELLRTKTPAPTEHWQFTSMENGRVIQMSSPHTPKAPRHGPRPSHLHTMDMKQISAVLFHESSLHPRRKPPGLPRPAWKSVAPTRVLLYEDELCQAVAHNKLL
ncbi:F-box protein At4g35930-like [Zingiber officinale]|uniref:F-box domain-containing protein n=1 Tax=Zingiber officinale TaxID=94328 RepID=A0A8J5FYI2_ZINOF|nr:F-box protein At4g35930-like [Zingiber officinale]KAG6496246.1 hypothetical protein ZIOFF_044104 [Zingiber officinale]